MDEKKKNPTQNTKDNPVRRRRKRTKWQNFKEAYLPVIIFAAVIALIVFFIASSFSRANKDNTPDDQAGTQPVADQAVLQQQEAQALLDQAAVLAAGYDYSGAANLLLSFSGDMTTIDGMVDKYNEYNNAFASLIPYSDVTNVPHLSFNTLMSDVALAQADAANGSVFNREYVTVSEFSAILQKLYDAGYVLVSVHDLVEKTDSGDADVTLNAGKLYLPEGKKPIVLTLSGANYYSKMGSGFASYLMVDADGKLTCEISNDNGTTSKGSFDFIPVLSDFIERHPDFSYHGARAIIAVSGFEGLFGYRSAVDAVGVIQAVRDEGYEFACYTYNEVEYGNMSADAVEADLTKWKAEIGSILGDVDIMVYPYGDDFTADDTYSGSVYDILSANGFHYLIGTDSKTPAWGKLTDDFFLQTRRWVNGTNMAHKAERFGDLFDAASVLDQQRTAVPK